MGKSKKKAVVGKGCVACGSCVKSCPLGAISIYRGLFARVDEARCIGCGRCEAACPAQVIAITAREVATPC